ncbi:DMT family transporter [Paenibacillus flagellatus]|uniref:QacE family quaternary ammonium compound efflux SMR transporter n=1 Tax=Paenibacillus flagellatus TaxID=2211139 RepID=A0A2V5JZI5_9BACL|nr:multidrug efflux SMR transporter [Paenibacillus flagellatus]PYI52171.1 QacE family quaternary ammonium compound efflux SMR transporter [Paenibacillus flagellatus]
MKKEWWLLLIGGVFEAVWVSGLKHASAWWEWLGTVALILASFKVLIDAAAKLPVGTVYAVFAGLGTAATVVTEIVVYGEPVHPLKLLFISTLAAGVIGLKLVTADGDAKGGEA